MNADLTGKVALVTGAGRGIGRAISLSLARAGARVFLTARTAAELEDTAREIRGQHHEAEYLPAEVSSEADVGAVFRELEKRFGRLDILVNNAGLGMSGAVVDVPVSGLDTLMSVNVRGVFLCCQKAMQIIVPAHQGSIVNISSVVGFKGYANQAAYVASKHAVMGLTKALAVGSTAPRRSGVRLAPRRRRHGPDGRPAPRPGQGASHEAARRRRRRPFSPFAFGLRSGGRDLYQAQDERPILMLFRVP
jgi:3-oxoacyl-[acyl-carrier protein] reductase